MKILAIETSQLQATVALLNVSNSEINIISTKQGSTSVAHSESLIELIQDAVKDQNVLQSVDAFAVGVGPGSFTGIRIGMATAKAFAQVFNKKMISFSSLQALYYSHADENLESTIQIAAPNAYQGLIFAGYFLQKKWIEEAILPEDLLMKLKKEYPKPEQYSCFGNGFTTHKSRINDLIKKLNIEVSAENKDYINEIGILKAIQLELLKPNFLKEINEVDANYLRASQAELKLNSLLTKN